MSARPRALALVAGIVVACSPSGADPEPYTAKDLATAKRYDRLVFHVDAVPGFAPRKDALDQLLQQLDGLVASGHLGKPGGVAIDVDTADPLPAAPSPDHAYTTDELVALSERHGDSHSPGSASTATVHMLYVDGHAAGEASGSQILGVTHDHDLIVIFAATLASVCAAKTRLGAQTAGTLCTLTEASVLVHETGHALGLVNRGLPMVSPHQDAPHGAHDASDHCVMYYASETAALLPFLIDSLSRGAKSVAPFDDACLADLAAAQR